MRKHRVVEGLVYRSGGEERMDPWTEVTRETCSYLFPRAQEPKLWDLMAPGKWEMGCWERDKWDNKGWDRLAATEGQNV